MILNEICYPVIHFGRVIRYVRSSPPKVSLSLTSILCFIYEYFRLWASIDASVSPLMLR